MRSLDHLKDYFSDRLTNEYPGQVLNDKSVSISIMENLRKSNSSGMYWACHFSQDSEHLFGRLIGK